MGVVKKQIISYMTTEIQYLFLLHDETEVGVKATKGHTLNISTGECEIVRSLERETARMINLAERAVKDSEKPIVDLSDEQQDLSEAVIPPEDALSGQEANEDTESRRGEKLKALEDVFDAVNLTEHSSSSEYKKLLYNLLLLTRANVDAVAQGQIDDVSHNDAILIATRRLFEVDEFGAPLSDEDTLNENKIINGIRSFVQGTESDDSRIRLQKRILDAIDGIDRDTRNLTIKAADSNQIRPTSGSDPEKQKDKKSQDLLYLYNETLDAVSRDVVESAQSAQRARGSSRPATPVPAPVPAPVQTRFVSYI
jgi:hypothetical protein